MTAAPASDLEAPEVTFRVKITPRLVLAILWPYVSGKFKEQIQAVMPISAFLFLFQLVVLRRGVGDSLAIVAGLTLVMLGLMFFMEGLKLGLMPLGQMIGATLPLKARMSVILGFCFVVGVMATLAEPAIGALKGAGANIKPEDAPLLYELLNRSTPLLVASVGAGVGIATVLGVFRFVKNWSLKVLILPALALALPLTLFAALNDATREVVALAWDTGAVTTGPVTVPLVLALGIGVSAVLGKADTGMSGFGIVTLASLWPVIMVLLTSLVVFYTGNYLPGAEAASLAVQAGTLATAGGPSALDLFVASMQGALQALIPLVLLLYIVQRFVLKEEVRNVDQIVVGIVFGLIGLMFFSLGLGSGLGPLGQQVGGNVPNAFGPPDQLYGEVGGKIVALLFAALMGYGATLAEPALNALGITVEEVTSGAFKKGLLIQAVAIGVALGLTAGLAKIMFNIPLAYLVIPSYLLLIPLTLLSEEKFVNIGWDSAGVTTGPITVPLVLAVGLGIGTSVGVTDGFGMLAMASIGPILTVLLLGIIVSKTTRAVEGASPQAPGAAKETIGEPVVAASEV